MPTPSVDPEKPIDESTGSPRPGEVERQKRRFRTLVPFLLLYFFLIFPIGASYVWSGPLTTRLGRIIVVIVVGLFYSAGLLMFHYFLLKWEDYEKPKVGKTLETARKSIVPVAYGLASFFVITMVYLWASELTWSEASSNARRVLPPIGRAVVLVCLLALGVLSHALFSYRYAGKKLSDLFTLKRLSRENRLRKALERRRQLTNQWLLVSLGQYLLPISIIACSYFWADKLFSEQIVNSFSEYRTYATICGLLIAYLLGGLLRDLQRYRYRMFAVPLYSTAFLFALLVLAIVYHGKMDSVADELVKNVPWLLALAALIVVLGPQIRPFLRRVQKAELPGGMKLELGELHKLDEVQQSVSPWRKTVTRFDDLVQSVAELIEDTPDTDVVRFLAYTPALGFLTLAESEWERLRRLLLRKSNIQITCLEWPDLQKWHGKFIEKSTHRPVENRQIDQDLIDRANEASKRILDTKLGQSNPRAKLAQIPWKKLPGYYLFANSKRAIIATPLFLPDSLEKNESAASAQYEDTPVTILGFESTDNWTVWLVHKVCDRYMDMAKSAPAGDASQK